MKRRSITWTATLVVAALLTPALPVFADDESGYLLRYAVLYGDPHEQEPSARASGLVSNSRLSDLLLDWDPSTDDAELRRLLALKGLYEMARQAVELPPRGGRSRGVFHVRDQRLDIEIAMSPREEPDTAEYDVRIYVDGELTSAPRVISHFGQLATITTGNYGEPMLFFVIAADRMDDSAVAPAAQKSEIERIDGIPVADGERVEMPRLIEQVAHEYTAAAREARLQGTVLLRLRVAEDGHVRDAKVVKSLPLGLDQAAVDAARKWRFESPRVDGEPSEVLCNFAFQFAMDED